ncbi:hypothetical protein GQ42DRAFT_160240 [Ramicandelaber brevisporus]|nr:hypothetical protein GQ42DRAFT_160240 [Ramicandelaber brevisporus]
MFVVPVTIGRLLANTDREDPITLNHLDSILSSCGWTMGHVLNDVDTWFGGSRKNPKIMHVQLYDEYDESTVSTVIDLNNNKYNCIDIPTVTVQKGSKVQVWIPCKSIFMLTQEFDIGNESDALQLETLMHLISKLSC